MAPQRRRLPIVAWWPNLIIMFELTMLGAIAATVILVGVENPPDSSLDAFERALSAPPGARVKKI